MTKEQIFKQAEALAAATQTPFRTGLDAVNSANKLLRLDNSEAMFKLGDVVKIPTLEEIEKNPKLAFSQKMTSTSKFETFRVICSVKGSDGLTVDKPLYATTLLKFAIHRDTKVKTFTSGSITDFTAGATTEKELFDKLFGKTLTFDKVQEIPVRRQQFGTSNMIEYNSNIFEINVK